MANYSMRYRMQLDAYRSTSVEKILVLMEGTLQRVNKTRNGEVPIGFNLCFSGSCSATYIKNFSPVIYW